MPSNFGKLSLAQFVELSRLNIHGHRSSGIPNHSRVTVTRRPSVCWRRALRLSAEMDFWRAVARAQELKDAINDVISANAEADEPEPEPEPAADDDDEMSELEDEAAAPKKRKAGKASKASKARKAAPAKKRKTAAKAKPKATAKSKAKVNRTRTYLSPPNPLPRSVALPRPPAAYKLLRAGQPFSQAVVNDDLPKPKVTVCRCI